MSEKSTISFRIDLTNPGQFYACGGLLELANRKWDGAEGWFNNADFNLRAQRKGEDVNASNLLNQLAACVLTNTMSAEQITRLEELSRMAGSVRAKTPGIEEEKKLLEKYRREEPILLHAPFDIRLDWFQDNRSGGSRFKTWAGQQSVLDIATSMQAALRSPDWPVEKPDEWLSHSVAGCGLPFNFDSDLGGQGSALDIGFSFDPLAGSATTRIESSARPCLELLAFVGLQRFRPRQLENDNRYLYCAWNQPLPPEVAAPAACGMMPMTGAAMYEFRLLYRTKYLKSFLPAIPFSGGSNE